MGSGRTRSNATAFRVELGIPIRKIAAHLEDSGLRVCLLPVPGVSKPAGRRRELGCTTSNCGKSLLFEGVQPETR
eukprot:359805-Rhodomonas_salina.1